MPGRHRDVLANPLNSIFISEAVALAIPVSQSSELGIPPMHSTNGTIKMELGERGNEKRSKRASAREIEIRKNEGSSKGRGLREIMRSGKYSFP